MKNSTRIQQANHEFDGKSYLADDRLARKYVEVERNVCTL